MPKQQETIRILRCILAIFVALPGCGSLGPASLKATRLDYNLALQKTGDEQLLLNLVRLRYQDNPYFLEVSSIASQLSFSGTGSVTPTFTQSNVVATKGRTTSTTVGGTLSYTETPIVTYSPMQGSVFVTSMLTPLTIEELHFLARSGWSVSNILNVCVQQINGIINAPQASGPSATLGGAPTSGDFRRIADFFEALGAAQALEMTYQVRGGTSYPVVQFNDRAQNMPQAQELRNLLGLRPGVRTFFLTNERVAGAPPDVIVLTTRSLLGIFFYLSQTVDVPRSDIGKGHVVTSGDTAQGSFGWDAVSPGIFNVKVSGTAPNNAAVAVPYRGHWFYIDDSDSASKLTFSFLSQLFSLKASSSDLVTPTLTLPLGT